jgi:hypothetical protein
MSTATNAAAEEKEAVILEILQIQSRLGDLYRQIKRASQLNAALTEETAILERYLVSLTTGNAETVVDKVHS